MKTYEAFSFDLEARGIRSTDGNFIRSHNLKKILITPTIAGVRELDGKRYPGTWTPLISPEDSLRLGMLLTRREGQKRRSPARKYVLTGYIRCGRCHGRMSGHALTQGRPRYVCRRDPGSPNCGALSVTGEPLEETVKEMLIAAVDDGAVRTAIQNRGDVDDGVVEAIRRDELALEALSRDFYSDALISREEFLAARSHLNARVEGNRIRLSQRTKSSLLGTFAGESALLRTAWENGTLDWRRSVVGALLEYIEVLPGKAGRLPFDPSRVHPVWKF